MKTNKDLKNAALAALKGHWGPAVIASLVMMVIGMAVSFSAESKSVIVILLRLAVTVLVSLPLSVGFYASYRKLYVDGDIKVTENMFGIAFGNWAHNLGGMLLMGVYTCLWSLLLIIPGIIKTFAYALTPFILNEKSELSANEAIELSTKMMDGHKMELFLLYLSFVGWFFSASSRLA